VAEKKYLSIEEIEAAPDVQYDEVEAWGGTLRIGTISANDMLDFVEANEGPAKKTAGLRLIVKSIVDGEGNRIGSDKMLTALGKKDSGTINKVVTKILELNGLSKEAAKKLGND